MKPILFNEDGTSCEVQPKNGTDFQLGELYSLLECSCVEVLRSTKKDFILIVDEEGRLEGKEPNPLVSLYAPYDIVGKAIVCPNSMLL